MAIETDTERAIFFDSDDFASSATFTDVSAGTSSTIKGIFDNNDQIEVKQKFGLKVISPKIFFTKLLQSIT